MPKNRFQEPRHVPVRRPNPCFFLLMILCDGYLSTEQRILSDKRGSLYEGRSPDPHCIARAFRRCLFAVTRTDGGKGTFGVSMFKGYAESRSCEGGHDCVLDASKDGAIHPVAMILSSVRGCSRFA